MSVLYKRIQDFHDDKGIIDEITAQKLEDEIRSGDRSDSSLAKLIVETLDDHSGWEEDGEKLLDDVLELIGDFTGNQEFNNFKEPEEAASFGGENDYEDLESLAGTSNSNEDEDDVAYFVTGKKANGDVIELETPLDEFIDKSGLLQAALADVAESYQAKLTEAGQMIEEQNQTIRYMQEAANVQPQTQPTQEVSEVPQVPKTRKTVILNTSIGDITYTPVEVQVQKSCFIMYFAADNPPMFVPKEEAGLQHTVNYEDGQYLVQYIGGMFPNKVAPQYLVMTFVRLD